MMKSATAQDRWERYRDELGRELSPAESLQFQVPGWEPIDRDPAFRWLQASIYEGFQVFHKTCWDGKAATVIFFDLGRLIVRVPFADPSHFHVPMRAQADKKSLIPEWLRADRRWLTGRGAAI